MASILPTTTVPQRLYLPPTASDEDEPFVIPELGKITGPIRQLIEQRLAWGAGKKDEVWEGVYRMSPDPTNSHQQLIYRFCAAIDAALQMPQAIIQPGGNVSDRAKQWYKNYRCPDVIVVLPGNPIQDRKKYWLGGPDFVVEVLSEGDDSVEKLPFYAKLNTREVLHLDSETKELTLFTLRDNAMQVVGTSSVSDSNIVASAVLPMSFQVLGDPAKPVVRVQHTVKPESHWDL